MQNQKAIEICKIIAEDVKRDTKERGGQPFDGRTIGIALGKQAATIQALANILRELMEKIDKESE